MQSSARSTARSDALAGTMRDEQAKCQHIMPDQDTKLFFDFFFVFSRFEYALKENGFCDPNIDEASPNWDAFARSLVPAPNAELQLVLQLGRPILANPPQKHIRSSPAPIWETRPSGKHTDIEELLVYIRRIRNNVFHGSKLPMILDRDRNLILCSTAVIKSILEMPSLPHGIADCFNR